MNGYFFINLSIFESKIPSVLIGPATEFIEKLSLSDKVKTKTEFYFGGAINNFKAKHFYF